MPRTYLYEDCIENKFCLTIGKWAREHNILLSTVKLNLRGRRGWPDRLVMWSGGNMVFIEFKRKDEVPRKLQAYIHEAIAEMGFEVKVYDDADIAIADMQAKIRATAPTDEKHVLGGAGGWIQAVLKTWEREDGGSS